MVVASSPTETEKSESSRAEVKTRSSRQIKPNAECYIIDPIPEFSDAHRVLVIESWHFVIDHISEVSRLMIGGRFYVLY